MEWLAVVIVLSGILSPFFLFLSLWLASKLSRLNKTYNDLNTEYTEFMSGVILSTKSMRPNRGEHFEHGWQVGNRVWVNGWCEGYEGASGALRGKSDA